MKPGVPLPQIATESEPLRLLLTAVEQSPVSVVVTDPSGRIVYVNPHVSQATGYRADEVIGKNVRLMKSGKQTKAFYQNLWNTINAGQEWHGEFHNRKKNGELFWEHASISPVRNEYGAITHFLAVKEDVTLKKLAEEELLVAREAAEAAIRAKDAFLANMSHELRTPLNAINGVAQTLLEQEHTSEMRSSIELIRKAGQDLLDIVQEVLCFSGLQAGKLNLENQRFALLPVIMHALHFAVEAGRARSIEVDYWIAPSVPAEVTGDAQRLQQVLVNLLGNSVKFTQRGRVHLSVRRGPDKDGKLQIDFVLSDTGIGIEAGALARLFQPFTQADDTITRRFGGTGLGLAISKALVEKMGGRLIARSRPGFGTCFRWTAHFGDVPNSVPVLKIKDAERLDGIKVGLLEPRSARRTLFQRVLEAGGAEVRILSAADLERPAPGFVVVDFSKPPLVRVSAGLGDQLLEEVQRLSLPFSPEMLCRAVRRCAGGTQNPDTPVARTERLGDRLALRILVADDIRTNQETLRMILRHLGFSQVTIVDNGAKAVDAAEHDHFDLIILDLHMPVMDGLTAARLLRNSDSKRVRETKIVALTASTLQHDHDLCIAAGMDGFLTKPVLPADIVASIQLLFSHRLAREKCEPREETKKVRVAEEPKPAWFDEERLALLAEAAGTSETPDLLAQMVTNFAEDLQSLLPEVTAACAKHDGANLKNLVHGAKGGALTIGWHRLGTRCAEVLTQLRNDQFRGWDSWPAEFAALAEGSLKAWAALQATVATEDHS